MNEYKKRNISILLKDTVNKSWLHYDCKFVCYNIKVCVKIYVIMNVGSSCYFL